MPRAIAFFTYGSPDVLETIEIVEPHAHARQVRVRVQAAGVNPVDCRLRRGEFAGRVPVRFPQRLGNEFAGVVDQVGENVAGFVVGSEVLGFTVAQAYAEVVVASTDQIVAKPANVPWEVAGGLSAVGQMAFNALEQLGITSGETLLIHAAAGGVGTVAVQLARQRGATVIGTASEGNHAYIRSLGAIPVTYGNGLVDRVRALAPDGVDAALDAIGGEAIPASVALVPDKDRIGTTVDAEAAAKYGVRRLVGARSTETLAKLVNLYAQGKLSLPIHRIFPLTEAVRAHREVETGHVRGKVILTVG
ncbi:MAG: NADP-dependent oxidoreductase [Chloroflexi bacterium]|nr:NADP-dependent oxidoreductase [Chloroflexota bacterium]